MTPPNKPEGKPERKPKRKKAKFKVGQVVAMCHKPKGEKEFVLHFGVFTEKHENGEEIYLTDRRWYLDTTVDGTRLYTRPLTKKERGE